MAVRKSFVETRGQYANELTKMEGGKSSVKAGDGREWLRRMVKLDAELTFKGYKSALIMLRRESVQVARKMKSKKKK